ncbi:PREDICTED: uncharacterized protein LOC108362698 [Rhagoletis zephyria]|uniref:uncharacterized protein LOC108362698 n=1 Tax=Rhagoletis zephyria TaxID=28612 RepID=UPI0008117B4C|nr:PREDICTED: uncharacterized protein LOC108362698 [Rhagoletis zephyria]
MSNKSLNAYIHVLQYIQSNIFDMKPTTFTTDFEYGLRKALSQIYPQTKLKTCWFHFTQAVRRNASKLPNFMSKLNKDNDAKKLFRKFLILPLLKPDDILIGYQNLKNQALSYNLNSIFEQFIAYFERQWIKKEGASKFSVYNESIKTTSLIESFHGQLGKYLSKNGSFYKFIDHLLDVDVTKSIDFQKSLDGSISVKL